MAQIVTGHLHRLPWLLATLLSVLASVSGCSNQRAPTAVDGVMPVEIGERTFMCEIVADQASRERGLGGRESLDPDKGMLFSFPNARIRRFVMRDCVFPIDIIYLDEEQRIIAMHHMPVEEPQRPDESQLQYEMRLPKYSSRYNAKYAIELLGGTLEELDLEEGEMIELDTAYLQSITE